MFWIFKKRDDKKEIETLKVAVQTGFNSAKQDIGKITSWIKHLDAKTIKANEGVLDLRQEISSLKEEVEGLKNILSILADKQSFKQRQPLFNKQTGDVDVLNTVQTAVQTDFLNRLSTTERAIVYVLLNSGDMKLSHEDLASILGKRKATIRGQINSIKQKSEGLISESIGENSKKRVYIPDNIREILLKKRKVRDKIGRTNDNFKLNSEDHEENI
jgi:hypothetical protein